MSQQPGTASGEEAGEPTTDSVFDILYHDARRVGSFVAQIDQGGLLTSLKQTEGAEASTGRKFSGSAGASVGVARAAGNYEDQATNGKKEGLERTYDPLWTNALELLDMLDERGMIHDGLYGARIGQFVKVSGSLSMLDLTLWKGLWAVLPIAQMMGAAAGQGNSAPELNRQQRRHPERQQASRTAAQASPSPEVAQSELVMKVLGQMPHTVQATLTVEGTDGVWCTLREEGMITPSAELVLKHGHAIAGRWTMVGVLDAVPDWQNGTADASIDTLPGASGPIGAEIASLMSSLIPLVRKTVGRPADAYGITPLMIFREVAT